MTVTPKSYVRKPFPVEAIQVSEENAAEVAEWCGGEVLEETKRGTNWKYIKVPVHRPLNLRQTKAFLGDWLLKSEMGFKVYTQRAFESSFEEASNVEGALTSVPAIQLTQVTS